MLAGEFGDDFGEEREEGEFGDGQGSKPRRKVRKPASRMEAMRRKRLAKVAANVKVDDKYGNSEARKYTVSAQELAGTQLQARLAGIRMEKAAEKAASVSPLQLSPASQLTAAAAVSPPQLAQRSPVVTKLQAKREARLSKSVEESARARLANIRAQRLARTPPASADASPPAAAAQAQAQSPIVARLHAKREARLSKSVEETAKNKLTSLRARRQARLQAEAAPDGSSAAASPGARASTPSPRAATAQQQLESATGAFPYNP